MSETAMVKTTTDPGIFLLWCPGCAEVHQIWVPPWTFDGNMGRPTVSPSILVGGKQWDPQYSFHNPRHLVAPGQPKVCHSFVRDGRWEYLPDSTHVLAGQTVDGVPFEAAAGGDGDE